MTHYESHPTSVMNIDVTSQKLRWCIDHIISTIPEICTETIPFTGLSGCSFPPDDFILATENHPANLCACAPLWYQRTQLNMLENHENIMKHVVCASLRILPCCHPWSPPNTTSLLHYPGSMRHFQCQLHAKLGHHTKLPTASKALSNWNECPLSFFVPEAVFFGKKHPKPTELVELPQNKNLRNPKSNRYIYI